jgi:hypothetical protein
MWATLTHSAEGGAAQKGLALLFIGRVASDPAPKPGRFFFMSIHVKIKKSGTVIILTLEKDTSAATKRAFKRTAVSTGAVASPVTLLSSDLW